MSLDTLSNVSHLKERPKSIKRVENVPSDLASATILSGLISLCTIPLLRALMQQRSEIRTAPGYLYKGDIPDEIVPRFLDWDKPLTKDAPQEVKDSFNSILQKYPELKEPFFKAFRGNKPGSHYYSILSDYAKTGDLYKNQFFASKVLEDAGIRGIRYLDQGSRGEGKGTSNFIPFRPEDFKIQEINDIPLEEYIAKGLLSP